MDKKDCFTLGYIGKFHGIRGEVNVKLDVDDPTQYEKLKSVFVEINGKLVAYEIKNVRLKPNETAVVKFETVNTANDAEALTGSSLFLPLTSLPKLNGNKFYYHEVIGFSVNDKNDGNIGEVEKVLDYSHQAVLQLKFKEKEVLVPITDDIILNVNRTEKTIDVDLPDGLLDVYLGV